MWYYLAAISLLSVILCVYDKSAARLKVRRISEKTLFFLSALGGALFMFITMIIIRHKTKKASFMIFVPLMAMIHLLVVIYLEYRGMHL